MNASSTRDQLDVQAIRLRYARIPLLLALLFTLFLVLRVPFTQSSKSEAQVVRSDTSATQDEPVEVPATIAPTVPEENAAADDRSRSDQTSVTGIGGREPVPEVDDSDPTTQIVLDALNDELTSYFAETLGETDRGAQAVESINPIAVAEENEAVASHEIPTTDVTSHEISPTDKTSDASPQPTTESTVSDENSNGPGIDEAIAEPSGVERDVTSRKAVDTPAAVNLTLYNPRHNGGEIHYVVNGEVYSMHPGQTHALAGGPTWSIEFHRGGSFGDAEVTLSAGTYAFQVSEKGWTLSESKRPSNP